MTDRNEVARAKFQQKLNGNDKDQSACPRIAIGIPSMDTVHADFAMALAALAQGVDDGQGRRIAPEIMINTKSSLIAKSRNTLVAQAQSMKADWLLMIDSDMKFPNYSLARLLMHDKDIVAAAYVQRNEPHALLAKILGRDRQAVSEGIHEVAALPTGMMLIRMSVFDKLTEPYFRTPAVEKGQTFEEAFRHTSRGDAIAQNFQDMATDDRMPKILGEDYYFCAAARAAGFQVWMDVSLTYQLSHIGMKHYKVDYKPTLAEADRNPATEGNMVSNV